MNFTRLGKNEVFYGIKVDLNRLSIGELDLKAESKNDLSIKS